MFGHPAMVENGPLKRPIKRFPKFPLHFFKLSFCFSAFSLLPFCFFFVLGASFLVQKAEGLGIFPISPISGWRPKTPSPRCTPKGSYFPSGCSGHLLENPLLRNSSQNPCLLLKPVTSPLLRTLPRMLGPFPPQPVPFLEPSHNPSWKRVLLYSPLGMHTILRRPILGSSV